MIGSQLMQKRVALVTGSEPRHNYVASNLNMMVSDCLILEEKLKVQNSEHFNQRRKIETDLLGLSTEKKEKLASRTVSTDKGALNDDPLILKKLLEFDADIIFFLWMRDY